MSMITPTQKEPDLAIAGLALIVIFGLLMWHDNPIRSDRPFDPTVMQPQYPHTTGYAYESWLWQDPFSFDSREYVQKDQYHIELDIHKDDKSSWPEWLRLRKKLDLEGDHESGNSAENSLCATQFNNHFEKHKKKHRKNHQQFTLRILLSLANVRPNTVENKEIRVRQRYAVTAGLIESGYYPIQPDRLYFCSSQSASSDSDRQFDVRWEYFSDVKNENIIIVAWADSDVFKKNLEDKKIESSSFTSDINRLFAKDKKKVNDTIKRIVQKSFPQHSSKATGTKLEENDEFLQSSHTFQVFYEKLHEKNLQTIKQSNKNSYIFDWTGAIDTTDKRKADKLKEFVEVVQPAQIDKKLFEKLVKELKNRKIDKPSDIAIITEQDSGHIRELASQFSLAIKNCNEGDSSICPNVSSDSDEVTTFSYFKGLDAYQQIINKQKQNEDYQTAQKWEARLSVTDLRNPPVGPAQFDYLHRIAKEISQTHDMIDLEKRVAGIKAVGIFGSDFYDKLLILKALRTEMPNLLVFTTGLDAQMLHPQHWRWTRNLVVASPFDLRLDEAHQKVFPPFRDSQQTEIFYRTLRILGSEIENETPLIFEIGRNGPVRLTLPKENENSKCPEKNCELKPESEKPDDSSTQATETTIAHLDTSNEQTVNRIWLLFGIALAVIIIIAGFRPHSGALVFGLLFLSLAILGLAFHAANDTTGESFSFTNGTSLWPTIFIQMTVIFLVFAFIVKGLFELETNFARLNRQYFKNRDDLKTLWREREPLSIKSLLDKLIELIKSFGDKLVELYKKFSNNKSLKDDRTDTKTDSKTPESQKLENPKRDSDNEPKTWPFYFLALILIVASGVIYAINDANPEGIYSFFVCMILLGAMVFTYIVIECNLPFTIKAIRIWEEESDFYKVRKPDPKSSKKDAIRAAVVILLFCAILPLILYSGILEHENSGIWQSYFFWFIVILFTILFIFCFYKVLEHGRHPSEITQNKEPPQKFLNLEESNRSGLWREYYQHGRFEQILIRVAVMWLFFAIIETILFYLLPPWPSPCRGDTCDYLNQVTGIVGFIFTMLLTFFVLDAVRLNYYFIRKLRTKHPLLLLDDSMVLNTKGLSSDEITKFYHERIDSPLETLEKIVTLVAERTKVADRLIYYPLLCIMLMLFARITYFDNQDFPLSKGITLGAGISLLIFSGFMIRYEAQKLKQAAIMSAENLLGSADPDGHPGVRRLRDINDGIFQPMLEQPVMRALLLILASIGLFAGEYLMLANIP